MSVPDSDMLISISEALETPVSTLLGQTVTESKVDDLKAISEKLEIINLQLAQRKMAGRKNTSLASDLIVHGHSNNFCSPDSIEQSLSELGLPAVLKPPSSELVFTHLSGCLSE